MACFVSDWLMISESVMGCSQMVINVFSRLMIGDINGLFSYRQF